MQGGGALGNARNKQSGNSSSKGGGAIVPIHSFHDQAIRSSLLLACPLMEQTASAFK